MLFLRIVGKWFGGGDDNPPQNQAGEFMDFALTRRHKIIMFLAFLPLVFVATSSVRAKKLRRTIVLLNVNAVG